MTIKLPKEIEEKITRWKLKADLFLEQDIPCFIKTIDQSYFSGDIIFSGEHSLTIFDFVKNKNCIIFWLDVTLFEEYRKNKGGKNETYNNSNNK